MTGTSALPLSDTPHAAVATLFAGLLDDAAIFPPGDAPMARAVPGYLASRRGPAAPYIGAFLCSAPRLPELRDVLHRSGRLDLSLVVPGGAEVLPPVLRAVASDPRLRLCAVELPAGAAGLPRTLEVLDAQLPRDVSAYVEVPLDTQVDAAAAVVRAGGRRLKLRTGGTVSSAFPTSTRLAAGLVACAREGLPFKLTAGLHHAGRHRDGTTGFEHHGFLNVLAAVASAAAGGQATEVAGLLEQRDSAALARWAIALEPRGAAAVRELFVGLGTCSTAEPLRDLVDLGLLP